MWTISFAACESVDCENVAMQVWDSMSPIIQWKTKTPRAPKFDPTFKTEELCVTTRSSI
jgi:hypothetical protein